jgi:hypothetical protein
MNEQQRAVVQQLMDAARVAGITVQCAVVQQQVSAALAAGKALLEQSEPVQEPRGYQWFDTAVFRKQLPENADVSAWHPLYTTPPAQPTAWVGLTPAQYNVALACVDMRPSQYEAATRAIEAKLREKNGGKV